MISLPRISPTIVEQQSSRGGATKAARICCFLHCSAAINLDAVTANCDQRDENEGTKTVHCFIRIEQNLWFPSGHSSCATRRKSPGGGETAPPPATASLPLTSVQYFTKLKRFPSSLLTHIRNFEDPSSDIDFHDWQSVSRSFSSTLDGPWAAAAPGGWRV